MLRGSFEQRYTKPEYLEALKIDQSLSLLCFYRMERKRKRMHQNILKLFPLSVEDVAQSELLHGDGGENLIHLVFPINGRVDCGKAGQRHLRISFQIE